MLFPHNSHPSTAHVLLPSGRAIQVSGEEQHAEAIAPFLCNEGECWVYATIHRFTDSTTRTPKLLVEVRIDDRTVGRLTPKMSADMLPAIDHLDARGLTTAVRAIVKGNTLKADVVLYAEKAGELSSEWLESLPPATGVVDIGKDSPPAADADPVEIAPTEQMQRPPEPTNPAPAGWYADPWGQARLRWWSGSEWTGYSSD